MRCFSRVFTKVHVYTNVKFGGDLFKDPSTVYNHDIALLAAVLNCAGNDKSSGTKDEGIRLVNAYKTLGFADDAIALYSYPDNDHNQNHLSLARDEDLAFSIAFKNIGGYDLIVITLRGTNETGWIPGTGGEFRGVIGMAPAPNYSIDGYSVYNYLHTFENDVMTGLIDFVTRWNDNDQHGYKIGLDDKTKILISGHSLGGGAGNLLAADLNYNKNIVTKENNWNADYRTGLLPENIYAYTFGALNSIPISAYGPTSHAGWVAHNPVSNFDNIFNIVNYYDSFGPMAGAEAGTGGVAGVKPAEGALTVMSKFGLVLMFKRNYPHDKRGLSFIGKDFENHVIESYIQAILDEESIIKEEQKKDGRIFYSPPAYSLKVLCPVDVEVLDTYGKTAGKIVNNNVVEETPDIDIFVAGDWKSLLLPADRIYTVKLTGYDEGTMDYWIEPIGFDADVYEGESIPLTVFENVALMPGKMMASQTGGELDVTGMQLFVVDDQGGSIAEVLADGTEISLATAELPEPDLSLSDTPSEPNTAFHETQQQTVLASPNMSTGPIATSPETQKESIPSSPDTPHEPASPARVKQLEAKDVIILTCSAFVVVCIAAVAIGLIIHKRKSRTIKQPKELDTQNVGEIMTFCTKCGKQTSDYARFCNRCGNALYPPQDDNPKDSSSHSPLYTNAQPAENPTEASSDQLPWFFMGTILSWVITHIISVFLIWRPFLGDIAASAMNIVFYLTAIIVMILAFVIYLLWKLLKRNIFVFFSILAGIVLGLLLIISPRTLLSFFNAIEPNAFAVAYEALRGYAFTLPVVTLSMSLGYMLLSRGKCIQYLVIKAFGVILYILIAYASVYALWLGSWSFLPPVLISEMAAAVLLGVFASIAGKATGSATAHPPTARRFCGACGAETGGGNAFCPVCGNRSADQLP